MDIFNRDMKYAIKNLSKDKDFKLLIAYLEEQHRNVSAFDTDPCKMAYSVGKQDLVLEIKQMLEDSARKEIDTILEEYNERESII